MRNLLGKASVAQSLDGRRLTGSLPVPDGRLYNFGADDANHSAPALVSSDTGTA